ncbi:MAG: type II secretion system ATPase GspE [bacterium]|nr:type II secretion system ATPase GspE [bacterium]
MATSPNTPPTNLPKNNPVVKPEEEADNVFKPIVLTPAEEQAQSLTTATSAYATEAFAPTEEEMLKLLSEQTGMPFVEIGNYPIDMELLKEIPLTVAKTYKIFPLKQENGTVLVALSDPLNVKILDDLRLLLDKPVQGAIATEEDINDAINMYYGIGEETIEKVVELMQQQTEEMRDIRPDTTQIDLTDLEAIAHEEPVIRLVNLLLLQAIKDRASDLHVEPFSDSFRVRYRVDGVLHELPPPPKHLQLGVCSRLKVMAGMDIAERRMPQDGRIKLNLAGRQIDLRVSTIPTVWGESIVMRILDKSMMMMGLEQIGLLPEVHEKLKVIIDKPNGILLVTGPTGCGKTTTLYSALNEIYTPELKVITTEDPVEYELEGVVQVNINENIGLTFARCLRSILRQDPDVIMVGEIRDLETAQIAIQASLTGHLVLSTLHTNDAASTITRLIDMDIEPFLISSTLEAVVAQRLIRTICPACRSEYTPEASLFKEMGIDPADVAGIPFYHGRGCEDCNYTGYKGRIGIFELLEVNDEIRDLILERASTMHIARAARKNGMQTMREDGWQKVLAGITTMDEVLRVTYGVEIGIPEAVGDYIPPETAPRVSTISTISESDREAGQKVQPQHEITAAGEEARKTK